MRRNWHLRVSLRVFIAIWAQASNSVCIARSVWWNLYAVCQGAKCPHCVTCGYDGGQLKSQPVSNSNRYTSILPDLMVPNAEFIELLLLDIGSYISTGII